MKNNKTPFFTISGRVIHGKGIGKTVGLPTANISFDSSAPLPKCGVYAAVVTVAGKKLVGVTNIGTRPSVDSSEKITIETYMEDLQQEIYGEYITLELYKYIRPIQKFESLQQVKDQVMKDAKIAKQMNKSN